MSLSKQYSRLVDTNEPPDPTTTASLRNRRDVLRAEIMRLQEEERVYSAVLSPLRLLPLEILGEIFLLVTPDVLDQAGRTIVVDLCLVCKHWRDAALSTRRLWSGLSIGPMIQPEAYNKIIDWLSHSGDFSRTLEFNTWSQLCACPAEPCTAVSPVLHRLLAEGPPLHHLTLKLGRADCFRNFISSISTTAGPLKPCSWDSLISLDLAFVDYPRVPLGGAPNASESDDEDSTAGRGHWDESTDVSKSIFNHIPSRVITLHIGLPSCKGAFSTRLLSQTASLHVPPEVLQRLTTFTIRYDWLGDHWAIILKHCTLVETLTLELNGCGLQIRREQVRSPFTLPRVRKLRLRDAANIIFLEGIKTPALQELDLGMYGQHVAGDTYRDFLRRFLVHSGNATELRSLRICNIYISPTNLAALFAPLLHLELLTLDTVNVDLTSTWETLREDADSSPPFRPFSSLDAAVFSWLPCLKRLEMLQLPSYCRLHEAISYLQARKDPPFCQLVTSRKEAAKEYDVEELQRSGISLYIRPLESQ